MRGLRMAIGAGLLGLGVMALRLPHTRGDTGEARRLRAHFVTVERELLSRDVSALSAAQRVARSELVGLLRRYAAEGRFPRNEFLPGQVPFFRDSRGNLCAMAFLIAATGRGDLVDHVARTRNNAYVPELADEPGLPEWLDRNGLSLAEAARIQPTYGPQPPHDPSAGAAVAAAVTWPFSVISIAWNARSMDRVAGHRTRALIGTVAGGVNLGIGLAYIGEEEPGRQVFGLLNLIVGAPATVLGVRALLAKPKAASLRSARLTMAPIAIPGPRARFGIQGNLRF